MNKHDDALRWLNHLAMDERSRNRTGTIWCFRHGRYCGKEEACILKAQEEAAGMSRATHWLREAQRGPKATRMQ